MGIYIKNIDIPTEQEYIDIRIHADGTVTMPIGKHPYYRQLEITRVPTPHGRLIDADEQVKLTKKWIPHPDAYIEKRNADIVYYLEQADTVIEAEER